MKPDRIETLLADLQEEVASLRGRAAISDAGMEHLRAIYSIDFCLWYDPDNEACARYGKQLHPHILALNDELKFKR